MAGRIFINYRRGDDPGFTHALYLTLETEFEAGSLFMDVDDVQPGEEFVAVLSAAIAAADIMLVVIGPRWQNLLATRTNDPKDYVVLEIRVALERGKLVIPVLVGGSNMPRSENLPQSLRPLARHNAISLRPDRFRVDCQGLIAKLKDQLAALEAQRKAKAGAPRPERITADTISRALSHLEAPEASYRKLAAEVLGGLGPLGAEYIPDLNRLFFHDPDSEVWSAAAHALKKIGPAALPS
jgi:TIR domain